ncbi:MAG: hypothetical protein HC892_14820 [Saprospiraceae bacterium]|nr:hypothetical protein [Saprospiraceae bacterium]
MNKTLSPPTPCRIRNTLNACTTSASSFTAQLLEQLHEYMITNWLQEIPTTLQTVHLDLIFNKSTRFVVAKSDISPYNQNSINQGLLIMASLINVKFIVFFRFSS